MFWSKPKPAVSEKLIEQLGRVSQAYREMAERTKPIEIKSLSAADLRLYEEIMRQAHEAVRDVT